MILGTTNLGGGGADREKAMIQKTNVMVACKEYQKETGGDERKTEAIPFLQRGNMNIEFLKCH